MRALGGVGVVVGALCLGTMGAAGCLNTAGLTGGSVDASHEGGSGDTGASLDSAVNDAGTADSLSADSATADAAANGDASWCQRQSPVPTICLDFDEGNDTIAFQMGLPVTIVTQTFPAAYPGVSVALVDDPTSPSPPGHVLMGVPAVDGGGMVFNEYVPPLGPMYTDVRLAFAMRIDVIGQGTIYLASVTFNVPDGTSVTVWYYANNGAGALYLDDGVSEIIHNELLPANGVLTNLELHLTLSPIQVELSKGGTAVDTISSPRDAGAPRAQALFNVGVQAYDYGLPSDPAQVSYDNVLYVAQ